MAIKTLPIKNIENLFEVDYREVADFCDAINSIVGMMRTGGFQSIREMYDKIPQKMGPFSNLDVCSIPYVLRMCGLPNGVVRLKTTNIDHMLGFSYKSDVHENKHDLRFGELCTFPAYFADPDAVFRSNSDPDNGLIIIKELKAGEPNDLMFDNDIKKRENPLIIAARIKPLGESSFGLVVTAYEKTGDVDGFFEDLIRFGFCKYVKGDEGSDMTAYVQKAIGDIDSSSILTKRVLYYTWKTHSSGPCILFPYRFDYKGKMDALNLAGVGYRVEPVNINTLRHNVLRYKDSRSPLFIACYPEDFEELNELVKRFGLSRVEKIYSINDLLPKPVFEPHMRDLASYREEEEMNRKWQALANRVKCR